MRLIIAVAAAVLILGGTAAAATASKVFNEPVSFNDPFGFNAPVGVHADGPALYVATGNDATTKLPADAITTEGNLHVATGELVYGRDVTFAPGVQTGKMDAINVYGQRHFEPDTEVLATIQSGGRNLDIAFARVVSDRYIEIRLSAVPKAPVKIAYTPIVVNHSS
jgi:hypothetical protein